MATVSISDDRLVVTLHGFRRLFALRRGFEIPLEHVCAAAADPAAARARKGIRAPGTYLPGVITAGTYYRKGDRNFWDVRRPEDTIVIDLRDERYRRLIIDVPDPERAVAVITNAIAEASGDLS